MIDTIILGIVQGLTEFLPVSSSGHLVLFSNWLGQDNNGILMEVLLHMGTLLATIIVFKDEILKLIFGIFKKDPAQLKKAAFIIIACIPTGIVGITLQDFFEKIFNGPQIVSGLMLATATLLLMTKFFGTSDEDSNNINDKQTTLTWKKALLIGSVQSFAILPGISRSGTTICTALFAKVNRKEAGEFSFLISLPAVGGAGLLHAKELFDPAVNVSIGMPGLFGVIAAFVSGLIALKWLLKFVQKGKMYLFAPYMYAMGIFGLIYFN